MSSGRRIASVGCVGPLVLYCDASRIVHKWRVCQVIRTVSGVENPPDRLLTFSTFYVWGWIMFLVYGPFFPKHRCKKGNATHSCLKEAFMTSKVWLSTNDLASSSLQTLDWYGGGNWWSGGGSWDFSISWSLCRAAFWCFFSHQDLEFNVVHVNREFWLCSWKLYCSHPGVVYLWVWILRVFIVRLFQFARTASDWRFTETIVAFGTFKMLVIKSRFSRIVFLWYTLNERITEVSVNKIGFGLGHLDIDNS